MIESRVLQFQTKGNCDIVDLTGKVEEIVEGSRIQNGIATIFVPGSTAAVTTIEYEPGLLKDLKRALDSLIPENANYEHNKRWGDGNGHSHVRASFLGPSLTVPFENKKLQLGTWQQIVFIDLDVRPRSRKVIVQLMGE